MAQVLHVADASESQRTVRRLLERGGHELTSTFSGLDGIRLAAQRRPELILVDVDVRDLDGYEVTLRLRGMRELSGVPIIIITPKDDSMTGLAVGADGYVQKPIDESSFDAALARFLAGHRDVADESGEIRLRETSQRIVSRLEAKVRELSDANVRLEEMARLRSEFLRNVSHELATPLTPVVGYLRLLLDGELGELSPKQIRVLESLESSATRLRGVVDTLLDVSALETGRIRFETRRFDFGNICREAVVRARRSFENAGLSLVEGDLPAGLMVRGDPEKMRRAITHVLDNAVKFTPAGGTAAVDVVPEMDSPTGTFHCFRVSDDGPGLAESEIHRVLEPFYQADGSMTRSHGGVGLGLAFACRVMEVHGGGVQIQSPPGEDVAAQHLGGTLVRLFVAAQKPSYA